MSNLSSETLFHFTSTLERLQSIMVDGMRFGMFAEKIPFKGVAYFVRGISFCNIPLSMIAEHTEWYGRYALGLKRSTLREIGVSPVFYIHSKTKSLPKGSIAVSGLLNNPFLCYLKQHYGKQYHKDSGVYRFKKFYDEKEWRIFAGKPEIGKYNTLAELERDRVEKDRRVAEEAPLRIRPEMIEYIILEKPSDFSTFDTFLYHFFRADRDILLTKILYYTQIKKDF